MEALRFRWSSENEADKFEVHNPATGEILAVIQGGGVREVNSAVHAAHTAFHHHWRSVHGRERGHLLTQTASKIREHAEEIAKLETRENGKPLAQARLDVEACIASFAYFGSIAGKLPGDFFDSDVVYAATILEPYGVVAGIIPFNWPPIHTAAKLAPALAAGNAVVIKPPEQTPLTVIRILEIVQSVFPKDVVQMVPGHGKEAGAALAAHPMVSKISFTGATQTGASVVKASADHTTPTVLELGGKNGILVFEDADLDLALRSALEAGFYNQGEACTAGSRIIVHRSLEMQLIERLSTAVCRLNVGDGMEQSTHVGPLVTKQHQDRVNGYIALAEKEGAIVHNGANLPKNPALANGYFVAPTIITGVTPDMRVAREEIFGPVVCIIPFDTEEQAITIANDTEYGLTAAIFSVDHTRAMRVARRLDVGIVFINNYFRGVSGVPFGGTKGSGYGREHTLETLKEYGRVKAITFASGNTALPFWGAVSETGL